MSEYRELLKSELEKLTALAQFSSDTCTTAKFIAISDQRVQDLLLRKLDEGCIFVGVSCIRSTEADEPRVAFELEYKRGRLYFVTASFLVVVNVPARQVTAISDPYEVPSRHETLPLTPGGVLPFAVAVPSYASRVLVPHDALAASRAREQEFLASHRAAAGQPATTSSVQSTFGTIIDSSHNTPLATATTSGSPVMTDDTPTDNTWDQQTDVPQDTGVDPGTPDD